MVLGLEEFIYPFCNIYRALVWALGSQRAVSGVQGGLLAGRQGMVLDRSELTP